MAEHRSLEEPLSTSLAGTYSLLNGMVHAYQFNETGSTDAAIDSYGSTTALPVIGPGIASVAGLLGTARSIPLGTSDKFDGTGDGIWSTTVNDNFTLTGWVQSASFASNGNFFIRLNATAGIDFVVRTAAASVIKFVVNWTGSKTITSATGLTVDTWVFFAVTHEATTKKMELYVNSDAPVTGTHTSTDSGQASDLMRVGHSANAHLVDTFLAYDRVLTASEIGRLYRSGNGLDFGYMHN